MRSLDPFFEALISRRKVDLFWSAEFPYAGGTFYLADRNAYIAGKRFTNALLSASPIESIISEDDRVLEVGAVTLEIDNFPGRMADGSRFSDHVDERFQSRFVSVYANAVGSAWGPKRELVFIGVPRGRPRRASDRATVRLVPLSEHFLTGPVIRVVRPDFYPHARESDIGRGIPWVVAGKVRSVDGIMRRPRQASVPVADEDNEGDAQLGRPTITKHAVNETWTITAFDAQPTRFVASPSLPGEMGNAFSPFWGTNGRQTMFHWSFTPNAPGTVRGFKFQAGSLNPESSFPGFYLKAGFSTSSGSGAPALIIRWNSAILVDSRELNYQELTATFPPWPVGEGQRHAFSLGWVGPAGIQPKFYPGHYVGLFGNQVKLGLAPMTDDYVGEFFFTGQDPNWSHAALIADLYAKYPEEQFWPSHAQVENFVGYTAAVDDSTFGGRMIPYEVIWDEAILNRYVPYFRVQGSASGDQGYGTYTEDYESPNGRIKIPSSLWSGTPVHGDKWTFTTPGHRAEIVFAESRPASQVSAITEIFINEIPIAEIGAIVTKNYSASDGEGPVAMISTMAEVREEWRVRADLTASGSTNAGSTMLRTIRRAGVPEIHIDLATWNATIATLSGWNFAGMVDDPAKDYKAVLLDMAFQCRSRFEWPRDRARLRYIPDPGTEPLVGTITPEDLFLISPEGSASPNHWLEQTDAARVVNKVVVRYARNWSQASGANAYTGIVEVKNPQSIADFRERADDPNYTCDFITSAAVARNLANFELALKSYPPDEHVATVRLPWMKYEAGDAYLVDVP